MTLDSTKFSEMARNDFEFNREFRYLTGKVKFDFGAGKIWLLDFQDGKLANISEDASASDEDCKIVVGGSPDQWDDLLADKPRPFFQCIQSAAVKHQMKISSSNETFAYLPGLNRATTLLRQLKNGAA